MLTLFRYKPFRGRLAPIITMGVRIGATWYPIEVYVDSGSVYTVLHARIAEGIGFDYLTGERIYLQVGDGISYRFICTIWRYSWGRSGSSER